jgi:hypothetical protein
LAPSCSSCSSGSSPGAGAYASAEDAIHAFLVALAQGYLVLGNAVFTPLEQQIEYGNGPLQQVAVVALIALLFPYTFNIIILDTISEMLTGQPI